MALTDYTATGTATPLASFSRILARLMPASRRRDREAVAVAAPAKTRPAHEANYLADIGMEIGF